MNEFELIAPCHFGLEAVLKKEIQDLGYEISKVEDGKVHYFSDAAGIARSNMFIRTAERILIKAAEFRAESFEDLYQELRKTDWKSLVPEDGRVWVTKANSLKSRLFSPSDIQSVSKKAIADRLMEQYGLTHLPETGAPYPLRVSLLKDTVTFGLDTSGDSLHKRGYRTSGVKAPISETLAAALILLTPFRRGRILADPFCGSGTIPIEAALIATDTAPGLNRNFISEDFRNLVPKRAWYEASDEALGRIVKAEDTDIQGYDIDPRAIRAARENAVRAGMDSQIHFQVRDVRNFSHPKKYGFIITNPPYGERISEKEELPELYTALGERFRALDSWSLYFITSYEEAENYIGQKAPKNRKIYNGMLKTYYYQYPGPKPPKKGAAPCGEKS